MAWYLCNVNETHPVEYQTIDQVIERLNMLIHHQKGLGYQVVKQSDRVSFYEGLRLIDTVWIEDAEGRRTAIP
jgi:hypothetical protein